MKTTQESSSNRLSLGEVVERLAASPSVDGIALFGSRSRADQSLHGDIDLLILVKEMPVAIFQMLTHIGGVLADVLFVETEVADRVLASTDRVPAASFDGMFLLKMVSAQILYDPSGRLGQVQDALTQAAPIEDRLLPSGYSAFYSAWFWLNHSLIHLKRLVKSADPVYQTATDMMLLTALSNLCRAYFTVRSIPWQGEKAAIRHLAANDPQFLASYRQALTSRRREQKVELLERLAQQALAPAGELWKPGVSAVTLRDPEQHQTMAETALLFWEGIFPP